MDALFGEVDAVQAGEEETAAEKLKAITYSSTVGGEMSQVPEASVGHVEMHSKDV
jgi:hypothetical protein